MIGGQWAFNKHLTVSTGLNQLGVTQISTAFLLSSKFLWRQGIVRCPDYCSSDTPQEYCECHCPHDLIGVRTAYDAMYDYGIYHLNEEWIAPVMSRFTFCARRPSSCSRSSSCLRSACSACRSACASSSTRRDSCTVRS